MKYNKNLKAMALSMIMLLEFIPLTSFAQGDGFVMNDAFGTDVVFRDDPTWSFSLFTQGFGETPVGGGLLILTAVGAAYALVKRRRNRNGGSNAAKGTALLLAGLMLIGTTGCRKKAAEPIVNGGEKVYITVKVNGGSRTDITGAEAIEFEDGDKLYVGNNGHCLGVLDYSGGTFSGSITTSGTSTSDYLHFYLLGGQLTPTVSGTEYSVVIADQTTSYPVISYGISTVEYYGEGAYTATLENKCSLIKFNVDTQSTSDIYIIGMNNKVTIDFADNSISYDQDGDGAIRMRAKNASNETWAIVLPQTDLTGAGEAITNGYTGSWDKTAVDLTGLNQYIGNDAGIDMNLTTTANFVDLSLVTANTTLTDGCTAFGKLGGNYQISIAASASVTLRDVDITSLTNILYPGLTCLGNATINIKGKNTVISGVDEDCCYAPGIFIPKGHTLMIYGTDSDVLNASSNPNATFSNHGAGIGGGKEMNCGNIVIYGGCINATGSSWGAGIGGSEDTSCGYITINNGIVTATSDGAAGIGTGGNIYQNQTATCGDIIICGGTVTAFGGSYSAAIGSAAYLCSCGDIIISAVNSVTVTKGYGSPNSIGAGNSSTCGTVTIGGKVGAITQSPFTYPYVPCETFVTTSQIHTYNGTVFTITCESPGDSYGIHIGYNKNITITSNDGQTIITRVEFHCTYGEGHADQTTVTHGTLSWENGDSNGSIENVNATSVSMSNSYEGIVRIDSITVYYPYL